MTFIELFFDLVFVFAVTQLSHGLIAHLSWGGAFEVALLFAALWWVWIATSWVTNWLDPEQTPVRLLMLVLMLIGLMLTISIPDAFGENALSFAGALVALELVRSGFMLWAVGRTNRRHTRNYQRIISWQVLSAVFWIAGALHEEWRLPLWCVAVAVTWIAPAAGFYVLGIGYSSSADWDVDGNHMAERCSLFIIIALGESILVTGAAFSEHSDAGWLAFAATFVGTAAMWWIYFDTGAERGSTKISHDADPGRMARLAYTYLHLLIVAGIIVVAVGDHMVLEHAHAAMNAATAIVILGGPALYLIGNLLFKWSIVGYPPLSHMAGLAALAAGSFIAFRLEPLGLAMAASGILVAVALWETLSWRRGPK
ncbi:MAG: low temperature requirement protein A [Parvibaculaceae bacterium]